MFDPHRAPRAVASRRNAFIAGGLFLWIAASALAQSQTVVPNRITQPVDPDVRVTLPHNVHPLAQAKYDQGAASASTATGRILLVLRRSDTQETALRQYLADVQNPNSPNYRKWLSPSQFGTQYGVSEADLATLTAWLQSQGFTIDRVPEARNVIIFSGSFGQIEQAFNTTIHRYLVNQETHFANSTDPQIPAALAPVISGIWPLNDFRPSRESIVSRRAHFDPESKKIEPDFTLQCNSTGTCSLPNGTGSNVLFTVPADAATIYDTPNSALNGNYSAISSLVGGKSYDGTGVTIGVVGDANISPQDVANYRAAFLPSSYSANQPTVIIDGQDPGINGDDTLEALLDLEVSGGIAPGAAINLYTALSTDLQDGILLAIYRAIGDNNVSILNVSFGQCEAIEGTSGNSAFSTAWEQAAAQGISVTVASGDSGSAGCDNDSAEGSAQYGLAINGIASPAYDIAVGGTDYDVLANSFSKYVNSSNAASSYYRTALSYIPESPWNDSTTTNTGGYASNKPATAADGTTNIVSGGGGISSCSQSGGSPGTCTPSTGYPTPAFQTGAPGFSFSNRTIPDVSLLAGNGSYGAQWLVCSDDGTLRDCEQTGGAFTSSTTFSGVGGTSASVPAFAGMLALVSQSQGGVRLGQADNVLYNLAAQSALYPTIFHDVTTGNNSVVCQSGTPNCGSNGFLTGYNAGAGYDAVSGLGSVDVAQLIANWKKASFTPTTTSFTINNGTAPITVKHGTQLTLAAAVTPGAATGDVSFVNNSGVENSQSLFGYATPLSNGTVSVQTADLPGSPNPYNVYAYYGGDVKNAASQSNPVQVTISPEASTVTLAAQMIDPGSSQPVCDDINKTVGPCVGQSLPYGFVTYIQAQVKATSKSNTVATGDITLTDTAGPLPDASLPITSLGTASYTNILNPNQSLSVASHGFVASYAGDGSYQASNSGTPYSFKVVQGTTTLLLSGEQKGSIITMVADVDTDSIGLAPTGTVTFKAGSTTLGTVPTSSQTKYSPLGTIYAEYQISIPATASGLVEGDNSMTATYAGDANYSVSNGSVTVSVEIPSFNITGTALSVVAGVATGNTSTAAIFPTGGFTATVALTCAITSSPSGATSTPTCSLNPTSVALDGLDLSTSTLTINTTATTTAGAYIVTVTGTSGSTTESGPVNLTVTSSSSAGSFSLDGTAVTLNAGSTTGNTSTITVKPSGGFLGAVNLKCSLTSSPAGAMDLPTCSVPSSVTVSGAAATATMTISTTAPTSGALAYPLKNLFKAAGGSALACVLMFTIPARRRSWRGMLSLLVFVISIAGATGCGGGGGGNHPSGGTTTGTYVFTVSGASSSSGGGASASATVQLTVN